MRFALRAMGLAVMAVLSLAIMAVQVTVHSKHHFHHQLALDVRPPPIVTTTLITVATTTTAPLPPVTVVMRAAVVDTSASLYAEWTRVSVCEEGGWIGYASYGYPDSLGITRANWFQFGGGSDLSPAAQIGVAMRLIAFYHAPIPDQHGCERGGW